MTKRVRFGVGGVRFAVALALCSTVLASCTVGPQSQQYQRYSAAMVESGRFRTERTPGDARFTSAELLRNFELVVFEPEAQLARFYTSNASKRRLSKWTSSVRYALTGDGVTARDRRAFAAIAAKLSRLTGLRFQRVSPSQANMTIFILTEQARALLDEKSQGRPGYRGSITEAWIRTLNPPCFALFETEVPEGGRIRSTAIFIKAELKDPLRGACMVEEATQSLGPIFDHDIVRPSIFNDDQEFIALTAHDEALLRVLYDRRLKAGMSRAKAVDVARKIIDQRGGSLVGR